MTAVQKTVTAVEKTVTAAEEPVKNIVSAAAPTVSVEALVVAWIVKSGLETVQQWVVQESKTLVHAAFMTLFKNSQHCKQIDFSTTQILLHTNVATDMYFPFNQEELTLLYNQSKETQIKSIVQSFTRPLFHAFLASVRAGQFQLECEVLRYQPVGSLSMAEWHRR
jgi:hypothetical protein